MQIIIPMTGYGSRFVEAGYNNLKPFIEVCKRTIIEWIVRGMYGNTHDSNNRFYFICRKEHLDSLDYMRETLERICPDGIIISIDDWVKKGPVYDVLRSYEFFNPDEPSIINYCDFYIQWDYDEFCKGVSERGCDGAVPCYTGFHPNLIPEENVYATCKVDEDDYMIEIREKYSFEDDKTKDRHSPGVYYFKNAKIMKEYCQRLVDLGPDIHGEYYASLPYNFMVEDGLRVWVPANVIKFCQWGTPYDMKEFVDWSAILGVED